MVLTETVTRSSASPETLISRIASGERSAEHQLVAQYWRGLLYVLNRRVKDPQLANDLAQETFLTVILKARNGEIQKPDSLAAFIRQVGINLFIAHYRKEKGHKTDNFEDVQIEFPTSQASVGEKINHQQLVDIVLQVIKELPAERDRKILHGFYLENVSKDELCSHLALSPAHFDRVLYRAKNRLKQCLSVKLDVDLSQAGLSHILSVSFVFLFLTNSGGLHKKEFGDQVGELNSPPHYSNCMTLVSACIKTKVPSDRREQNDVTHE